jgi:hypothetical protein
MGQPVSFIHLFEYCLIYCVLSQMTGAFLLIVQMNKISLLFFILHIFYFNHKGNQQAQPTE